MRKSWSKKETKVLINGYKNPYPNFLFDLKEKLNRSNYQCIVKLLNLVLLIKKEAETE